MSWYYAAYGSNKKLGKLYQYQDGALLKEQAPDLSTNNQRGGESNLLKGKVLDQDGNFYSPSFTVKGDKRYRYYVNQAVLQYDAKPHGIITRLPARELEEFIISTLADKIKSGQLFLELGLLETDWSYQQITVSKIIHVIKIDCSANSVCRWGS